ncbi:MAG: hypothetical protein GX117_06030 [Candidatus Hydrogenedentes bacterium]|jgi:alpha-L-rhamnosidase|nr:hypothetical protein [Candidatus Hydrogenedentota bacterium]
MNTDMEWKASWIWAQRGDYKLYNDTIEAQRDFDLKNPASAILKITADTRYRLYINDTWVNDGPSRSWPEHYQYDQIDVSSYLREGANSIRIIAKFFGIGTFHQVPQEAGLLAQLEVKDTAGALFVLGTDESWQVRDLPAWQRFAAKQSVQMGPFEFYDARRAPGSFEKAVRRYTADTAPWTNLEERDCPFLTAIPRPVKSLIATNVLRKPVVQSFIFPTAEWCYDDVLFSNNQTVITGAFSTVINVPDGGTIIVDTDGNTALIDGNKARDNRFELEPGKHLLYVVLTQYWGHWRNDTQLCLVSDTPMTLENPLNASVESPWSFIPFSRDIAYRFADYQWALMEPAEKERIEKHIRRVVDDELRKPPLLETFAEAMKDRARIVDADEMTPSPYYDFQTRHVLEGVEADIEFTVNNNKELETLRVLPSEAGDVELICDLGEQNVGYYTFEIEAEEGLILDFFGVEYIAPDGSVQFTERYRNGMRYTCKEGKNRFTSLMRRSQRYLFITLRNQRRPAQIKKIQLIESTYPVEEKGSFTCSEPLLDRIWAISAHTLKLCMEDVFTDCPLYEQTLWVGDARNEALFNYPAFGHADIAKRCIRLAAFSLDHYPLVQCQVPSTWETIIPVWGFLWNIMIWDYYEFTGDTDFLEWVFPYAMKNLRNAAEYTDERGLFSVPFWNLFDWSGIDDNHATVTHNSMFAVGAIDAALKIANLLNKDEDKEWLRAYREQLKSALNQLWQDELNMYPDSVHNNGAMSEKISLHNVFLSLLYDIAPEDKIDLLKTYLAEQPENMTAIGSPFALLYLFSTLEKMGMKEEVVQWIRDAYEPMVALDATSVWETFAGALNYIGKFPTRSHTHAWSSSPLYFLNRIILGIVQESPGGQAYTISPHLCGLTWAKGSTARTEGTVQVEWSVEDEVLTIKASAPENVSLNFVRNESLKGLKIIFNGVDMQEKNS